MKAEIVERPDTFDRVDRVKRVADEPVLPGDDRLWILGSPLVVEVDGQMFTVPTGFTTDGASIPRVGQWLTGWDPWEPPQRWAAIVHDWLYCDRGVSKGFTDRTFLAVLVSEGANLWQQYVMFGAVVVGGWPAWKTDQLAGPRIYE